MPCSSVVSSQCLADASKLPNEKTSAVLRGGHYLSGTPIPSRFMASPLDSWLSPPRAVVPYRDEMTNTALLNSRHLSGTPMPFSVRSRLARLLAQSSRAVVLEPSKMTNTALLNSHHLSGTPMLFRFISAPLDSRSSHPRAVILGCLRDCPSLTGSREKRSSPIPIEV